MMQTSSSVRHHRSFLPLVLLLLAPGCGYFRSAPPLEEKVDLIAVLPIERQEPNPNDPGRQGQLMLGAERVVTAQIYGVLSSSSQWRFVPDLTVSQVLGKVAPQGELVGRAQALGREVGADAVIGGTVWRYEERVGSELGAREGAAVAFTLQLVSVSSGKILWSGTFDQRQQALSSNIFDWWLFWRGGPRWFSAQEFTRLGVERLMEQLSAQLA